MADRFENVRVIWDDTIGCEGWFARYDDPRTGQSQLDEGLDAIDKDAPDQAVAEARRQLQHSGEIEIMQ